MTKQGFSLVELLITLAILGVLLTFTVPSLLSSSISDQGTKYNYMARNTMVMIVNAYEQYHMSYGTISTTMTVANLLPYLNYVSLDTSRTIDNKYGSGTLSCNVSGGGCLILHNGGALRYNGSVLAGLNTTNALEFVFDPDGIVTDGTTNGPGKAVDFFLYSTGYLRSRGATLPNTTAGGNVYASPAPSADPPWLSL
jgi:prepilin-type N-terminal cleavage/methylation domain-containing protein